MEVVTNENNADIYARTVLQILSAENMGPEQREEVLKAVALKCLASSFALLDQRTKELQLEVEKAASQGPVQSVAGPSQQGERPSVIRFATRIVSTSPTPSSTDADHGKTENANAPSSYSPPSTFDKKRTVDRQTTPPPPCVQDDTRTFMHSRNSPFSSSVNNGKIVNSQTSIPSNVSDENRTVDLRTPPPPCVEDHTKTFIHSTSSPSSSSVNVGKIVSTETSLLLSSSVLDENRTVDVTTPPLPCVEDVTRTFILSTSSPSSSSMNDGKIVSTETSLLLSSRVLDENRTVDVTTPPLPCVEDVTSTFIHSTSSPTSSSVNTETSLLLPSSVSDKNRTVDLTTLTRPCFVDLSRSIVSTTSLSSSTVNVNKTVNIETYLLHSLSDEKIINASLTESCGKNEKNMYNCDICGYKALTKLDFLKHDEDFHKKITTYQCSECSYETDNKRSLIRHCATHMKQNQSKQSKTTVNLVHLTQNKATSLKRKMRKHTNEKPFKCERCLSKFTWKYLMIKHMVDKHSMDSVLFKCGQCSYRTAHKGHLTTHERTHSGEKPYQCQKCEYRAARKTALVIHERLHSGEKPYQCQKCEFRTAQISHLITHEKIHSGRKPYQCQKCKYKTAYKSALVTHERIHSGEKPYQCQKCEYRTTQKSHLIAHERIHSGCKPYQCQKCKYKTACKSSLVTHERIHSGEKPYQCQICDYRAAQKGTLVTHLRKHSV